MHRILLVITVFIFLPANGQTDKGTWLIGGNSNFLSSKNTDKGSTFSLASDRIDIGISPNIGYFIVDKLAIGIKTSFSKYKDQGFNGGYSNINRFEFGRLVRYYFLNPEEKNYNILADINYQYGITKDVHYYNGEINTFSASAGTVIFFNTSVGLEFLLGYYQRNENIYNSYKTTQKGLRTSIGFQVHLKK